MKQRKFAYSVLKFRTSYVLDERVNIGLLFCFEDAGTKKGDTNSFSSSKYYFLFPKTLSRVSNFFSQTVKVKDISKLLLGFRKKINEVNRTGISTDLPLEDFIQSQLLPKDANSYFFSDVKHGFYDSEKAILDYFKEEYFSFFTSKTKKRRNDKAVVKLFWDAVKNKTEQGFKEKLSLFKSDIILENGIVETEFEYGWQNGTFNYVKALNFDLVDEGNISNKAFKWYGELTHLKDIVVKNNGRIDLLISKPNQRHLFGTYDKVLSVLEEIETPKKIIEEEQIKNYAENAVETITSLNSQ